MKSSYSLRSITTRTTYADGSTVTPGPAVSTTYPLGLFREDYQYNATSASTPDYLDEHNGRFCVTPEYPTGTYAYFCTVDANWNSAYPYAVGPTFYGNVVATKVPSIIETVTVYNPSTSAVTGVTEGTILFSAFPNPTADFIAVQVGQLVTSELSVDVFDMTGRLVQQSKIIQGSTITYVDTRTLYNGDYVVKVYNGSVSLSRKITIAR